MDRRYEDDRARRLDRAGYAAGATAGTAVGLALGALVSNVVGGPGALMGAVVGLLLGVVAGRAAVARVGPEEMDPAQHARPFVGAHTPDTDAGGRAGL